ncbi:hypothetical protein ACFLWW_02550 [Chloroflexota bacterium]
MVIISLTYEETYKGNLRDLSSVLDDFELLYKYFVVTNIEEYMPYLFPPIFWSRYGRPLVQEDQLQIKKLTYSSPLVPIVVISGWVATKMLLPLIQAVGEIADFPANRRKAKAEAATAVLAEIEKNEDIEYKRIRNRRERLLLEKAEYDVQLSHAQLVEYMESRQHNAYLRLQKRLRRNPYQLRDVEIDFEGKE